eukprot:COSAG06_NODE_4679_length_4042_cov_4.646704_2_plen_339_part_00
MLLVPLLLTVAARSHAAVVRGSLDGVSGGPVGSKHCVPVCGALSLSAAGWAVDEELSNGRGHATVQITLDGTVVASGVANLPRPDLVKAGVAPDPNHGFTIPLPAAVVHKLSAPSQKAVSLQAHVGRAMLSDGNGCTHLHCANAATDSIQYVEADGLRVGIDLSKGGSISFMSSSKTHGENIVNAHDMGREIQLSYYSGPNFYNPPTEKFPVRKQQPFLGCSSFVPFVPSLSWQSIVCTLAYENSNPSRSSSQSGACDKLFGHPGVPWPWNPIGAGDIDGNHGQILSFQRAFTSDQPTLFASNFQHLARLRQVMENDQHFRLRHDRLGTDTRTAFKLD